MKSNPGLIKKIQRFERVDSTNSKTKELLKNNDLSEGTFILAHDQYAGKGYAKNTWESEPGKNITGTLVLKPHFLIPSKQFLLTKILSLALKKSISNIIDHKEIVYIKWPNDIYINNRKVAGILVENSILGNTIQNSICGMGINVNQLVFKSGAPNPVSLMMITQSEIKTNDVIASISQSLMQWYNLLKLGKTDIINHTYHNSLYKLNISAGYKTETSEFTGVIKGTDDYGRLLIENEDRIIQAFDFKDVSFLRDH
jgi:BirA family biotin operon repressor/biotin-[acetyl-CoA-carboxylase] ligase